MGLLTEAGLDELLARGCPGCGTRRLIFRSYLDARLPLLGGEPAGGLTWVHDGEKFVDGVFQVSCAGDGCAQVLFSADVCPRCHAADGLHVALDTLNRWPVPRECPSCGLDELAYRALVPARVFYEGKRIEKPRTSTELYDPGFHGMRADCDDCGTVAELVDRCPLCDAAGTPRPRPGG